MLGALRQGGVGQMLMAGLVFAIIAVFILEFRQTSRMQTGSLHRECAARVDGECLTPKDYFAEFGLVVPRQVPAKQIKALSLRKQVLDGIIERELLVGEAARLGISANEEGVKSELRLGRAHVSLPAAQALRLGAMLGLVDADPSGITRDGVRVLPILDAKTGEVDDDLYGRVVRSMTNRSPKEFLKMQERELVAARMRDLVRSRVRVSEEEAFGKFAREKSQAVVRTTRLDAGWFAKWATDSSDEAVNRWAGDHKTEVDEAWKTEAPKWKADCTLASEIVLESGTTASEAQKSLLQEKIDRAKARLEAGVPFEVVARTMSDGPTANTGGAIGCLTAERYGEGGEALVKASAELAPGKVSAPLQTARGYHLLRVDGKLAAADLEKIGRLSVARPLAVRELAQARAKAFGEQLIKEVKGGARLDDTTTRLVADFAANAIVAHQAAVKKQKPVEGEEGADSADAPPLSDPHAPKAEVSAPFNVDGNPVPGLFGGPSLADIAFALDKPDELSGAPIAAGNGFVVLQLKEKTVATRDDFKTSRGEVVRALELRKRADALTRYVARLRQAKQDKIEISERILEEPKNVDAE